MSLIAETAIYKLASYATSLPEPVELLVFGVILATVAFLLRSAPARVSQTKKETETAEQALSGGK
jgi:hypothetical protein